MIIYALKHPLTKKVIDVQITNADNIKLIANNVKELSDCGLKPILDILEVVNYSGWQSRLNSWIKKTKERENIQQYAKKNKQLRKK